MLYVCIPVHDEAATIGVLLWRIRTVFLEHARDYEVVVYDDGSTDATLEVLEPYRKVLPLTVLRGERRLGTARAVDALCRHVVGVTRSPRRDGMVFMQGDFTDRPEDLVALAKLFEGGADVVVGRRPSVASQPPAERRLRRLAPWVLRPLLRVPGVDDLLTSFRVARVSVVRDALRARGSAPIASQDGWAAVAEFALALIPYARRVEVLDLPGRYDLRPRASRVDWWRELRGLAGWAWRARGRVTVGGALAPLARVPAGEATGTAEGRADDGRGAAEAGGSRSERRREPARAGTGTPATDAPGAARPRGRRAAAREAAAGAQAVAQAGAQAGTAEGAAPTRAAEAASVRSGAPARRNGARPGAPDDPAPGAPRPRRGPRERSADVATSATAATTAPTAATADARRAAPLAPAAPTGPSPDPVRPSDAAGAAAEQAPASDAPPQAPPVTRTSPDALADPADDDGRPARRRRRSRRRGRAREGDAESAGADDRGEDDRGDTMSDLPAREDPVADDVRARGGRRGGATPPVERASPDGGIPEAASRPGDATDAGAPEVDDGDASGEASTDGPGDAGSARRRRRRRRGGRGRVGRSGDEGRDGGAGPGGPADPTGGGGSADSHAPPATDD